MLLAIASLAFVSLPIAGTSRRLGADHAAHAIGLQVSAAHLGTAAIPGLAGVLARWHGLVEDRAGP